MCTPKGKDLSYQLMETRRLERFVAYLIEFLSDETTQCHALRPKLILQPLSRTPFPMSSGLRLLPAKR